MATLVKKIASFFSVNVSRSFMMRLSERTPHIVSLTNKDLKAIKNAHKKAPSEHAKQAFQEMKHML